MDEQEKFTRYLTEDEKQEVRGIVQSELAALHAKAPPPAVGATPPGVNSGEVADNPWTGSGTSVEDECERLAATEFPFAPAGLVLHIARLLRDTLAKRETAHEEDRAAWVRILNANRMTARTSTSVRRRRGPVIRGKRHLYAPAERRAIDAEIAKLRSGGE